MKSDVWSKTMRASLPLVMSVPVSVAVNVPVPADGCYLPEASEQRTFCRLFRAKLAARLSDLLYWHGSRPS